MPDDESIDCFDPDLWNLATVAAFLLIGPKPDTAMKGEIMSETQDICTTFENLERCKRELDALTRALLAANQTATELSSIPGLLHVRTCVLIRGITEEIGEMEDIIRKIKAARKEEKNDQ